MLSFFCKVPSMPPQKEDIMKEKLKNDLILLGVCSLYGKIKAEEIAKYLDINIHKVYRIARDLNVVSHLNPQFELTEEQRQIILGGILGDGSFKKNGSNYYYRETHAIGEKDYMLWKFRKLYNLTTKRTYDIPARNGANPQLAIQTVNSPVWQQYVEMPRYEVINALTELGYAIWMLDDGWICRKAKACNISVAGGTLTDEELMLLIDKGKELGLDGHIVGIKEKAITFLRHNNARVREIMYSFFPETLDIVIKKINDLKC